MARIINIVERSRSWLSRQAHYVLPVILAFLISAIWMLVYRRTSLSAWQTPISYGGDSWLNYGLAKAYMDGDIFPIIRKSVAHLNAPFSANWNDYPSTEELLFAGIGWLGVASRTIV